MTPPPAASAAEPLAPAPPADSKINRDLLRVMEGVSPGYFLLPVAGMTGVVTLLWQQSWP